MASPNLNTEQLRNIVRRVEEELGRLPSKKWEYSELLSVTATEIRKKKQHARWKGKKKPNAGGTGRYENRSLNDRKHHESTGRQKKKGAAAAE